MTTLIDQLKATIDTLSVAERSELARYLIDSLEPKEEGAKEQWLALAEQRMADVRAGRVVGIPADDVMTTLGGW